MAAAVTGIDMATKCSGSTEFNGTHGTQMIQGHVMGISVSRAVVTHYIRHLDTVRCPHTVAAMKFEVLCPGDFLSEQGSVG